MDIGREDAALAANALVLIRWLLARRRRADARGQCGIDHLDAAIPWLAFVQRLQHHAPPPPPPASELPVNRAPLAELAVQITPSRPCAGDLEDLVQRQPVISRPPPPPRTLLDHKRLGERHSSSDIKPQTKAAPRKEQP